MNGHMIRHMLTTVACCITTGLMIASTIAHNDVLLEWGVWSVAPAAVMVVDLIMRRERIRVEQIITLCERRRDADLPISDVSRIR